MGQLVITGQYRHCNNEIIPISLSSFWNAEFLLTLIRALTLNQWIIWSIIIHHMPYHACCVKYLMFCNRIYVVVTLIHIDGMDNVHEQTTHSHVWYTNDIQQICYPRPRKSRCQTTMTTTTISSLIQNRRKKIDKSEKWRHKILNSRNSNSNKMTK